jgi:hypothetical protein
MGGKKKHDVSARDFRNELLSTLATLSGGQSGIPIPFENTYDPICTAKGVSYDDYVSKYGTRDVDGKVWIRLWISGAFNWLKTKGWANSAGRGKWIITDEGLKQAKTATATPALGTATVDDDSKAKPAVAIPAPQSGVSFPVGPGNAEDDGYHQDAYIRTLAAEATRCFGYYTSRAGSVCGTCPLSGPCQNLVAATLSTMAAGLAVKDAKRLARQKAKEEAAARQAAQAAAATSAAASGQQAAPSANKWDNTNIKEIISYMDSTCYRCGKEIKKDQHCYWKKDQSGASNGLFHLECK